MHLLSKLSAAQDHSAKVLGAISLWGSYIDIMSKLRSDHGPEFHPEHARIIQCKAPAAENLPKLGCLAITLRHILSLLPLEVLTKQKSPSALVNTCMLLEMSLHVQSRQPPIKKEQFFLSPITDAKDIRINVWRNYSLYTAEFFVQKQLLTAAPDCGNFRTSFAHSHENVQKFWFLQGFRTA